jgi:hypothetical protein
MGFVQKPLVYKPMAAHDISEFFLRVTDTKVFKATPSPSFDIRSANFVIRLGELAPGRTKGSATMGGVGAATKMSANSLKIEQFFSLQDINKICPH